MMTQQPDRATYTVLFIDHSESDRSHWVKELRRCSADYEVLEASDMQSGLDLCRSQRRIDCVVLEVSLPDHEGFKTLVQLVPLAGRPKIAVIILTQNTERGIWELAKQNGAYICLAKEHSTGEYLDRAIQRAIEFVGHLPKEDRRHWHPSL